jgi:phage terminase large subunit
MGRSLVHHRTTAVKTGNGVGKSRFAGVALLWFWALHPASWAVVAAPTMGQLTNAVWKEVAGGYRSAERNGMPLGGKLSGLRLEYSEDWVIEGFGQGSVESKSGRHAGELLAVIDEASGVSAAVMEAIDSLNPSRYLYLGNPLRPEGKFYEICERSADNPHINVITVPSTESPDIHLERSRRGMADATWLQSNRFEYGEDSMWWASHVLAKFPGELEQALLTIAMLARAAVTIHVRSGVVRLGVDIAKGTEGDNSQIVARDDGGVLLERHSNRWSLEELANQVAIVAADLEIEPKHIVYDGTGIGTDFDNRLRQKNIIGAKAFLGVSSGGAKFNNLRSAAGWHLRRRLDANRATGRPSEAANNDRHQWQAPAHTPGGLIYQPQKAFAIPKHMVQAFAKELQGCRYSLDDVGRIALERKEDFQKRLKFSPNFLDALAMTFAFPN